VRNGFYFPGNLVQQAVCHNSAELSRHCVARVRVYSTISREASLFAGPGAFGRHCSMIDDAAALL